MGNQKSIESRKSKSIPESNSRPKDVSKSISLPKNGKDAYLFSTDIDNLIGKGG